VAINVLDRGQPDGGAGTPVGLDLAGIKQCDQVAVKNAAGEVYYTRRAWVRPDETLVEGSVSIVPAKTAAASAALPDIAKLRLFTVARLKELPQWAAVENKPALTSKEEIIQALISISEKG